MLRLHLHVHSSLKELGQFRFVEPSIPYSSMKEYPIWRTRLFCYMIISQGSQGTSVPYILTLLARSSRLYLCDRKIRKKPNPFPIWKIWFGLYWFGAVDGTGFSRLVAAQSAPFSSPTGAWFIAASSSPICVDDFRQTKKLSILSKALCWCSRWNWIRTRSACFRDLFFDEFYTLVIGKIAGIPASPILWASATNWNFQISLCKQPLNLHHQLQFPDGC